MPKIKKDRLPPTTLKGIETYLRNRGYRINPTLQDEKPRARLTFDKPLPDGRRIHGGVYSEKGKFKIKKHIDSFDPSRNPIGHLLSDWGVRRRSSISVVPKKKRKKK